METVTGQKTLKQYGVGDDYCGWTLMGWEVITVPDMPVTRMLFFRRVDPSIDDADEVVIMNGQVSTGAMFCLRNGRMANLPGEFISLATQP